MKKEKYDELLTFQKRERETTMSLKLKDTENTHIYIYIYIKIYMKSSFSKQVASRFAELRT